MSKNGKLYDYATTVFRLSALVEKYGYLQMFGNGSIMEKF
jgi:hypothetical protein